MTRPIQPAASVTLLPPVLDLAIYAGDDFFIDLIVTNPDGTEVDLDTAKPAAQVRTRPEEDPPIAEFVLTTNGNVLHLHLPSEGTAALPDKAMWDCQITVPWVTTLVRGTITTTAEITRLEAGDEPGADPRHLVINPNDPLNESGLG